MAARKYSIKWTNRWSHESGYVGKICADHFENTYDPGSARKFASEKAALNGIQKILNAEPDALNDFEIVS